MIQACPDGHKFANAHKCRGTQLVVLALGIAKTSLRCSGAGLEHYMFSTGCRPFFKSTGNLFKSCGKIKQPQLKKLRLFYLCEIQDLVTNNFLSKNFLDPDSRLINSQHSVFQVLTQAKQFACLSRTIHKKHPFGCFLYIVRDTGLEPVTYRMSCGRSTS